MISLRKSLASRLLAKSRAACFQRGFSATSMAREVQVFDMPSMSPTMEEGGIIEWYVKPGDKFSAGDVLVEVETDKAQISVEAGDDGILTKVLVEAGAKGIPVGRPIAVTAEEGDDIAAIDYDAILKEKLGASSPASSPAPASAEPAVESTPTSDSSSPKEAIPIVGNRGLSPLPAALRLISENGLSEKDIIGTGPYGRVTKGDVLAFLGRIPKSYPQDEQARFEKLQKLDLSNIRVATPKTDATPGAATEPKASEAAEPVSAKPEKPKPLVTNISVPLGSASLAAKVSAAQRVALRSALLSLKPKPSALRDSTLDFLTAPAKAPFQVKRAEVVVLRAKPVSLEVSIEEPPAATPSKAVEVYINVLKAELAEESLA